MPAGRSRDPSSCSGGLADEQGARQKPVPREVLPNVEAVVGYLPMGKALGRTDEFSGALLFGHKLAAK